MDVTNAEVGAWDNQWNVLNVRAVRSWLWEGAQNDGCNQDKDRARQHGILQTLRGDLKMGYDIDVDQPWYSQNFER